MSDELAVMAIVLTHNATESLERCVRSTREQTRPVDEFLVIDNASSPPVAVDDWVLRSEANTGTADGWALAVQRFLDGDADAV